VRGLKGLNNSEITVLDHYYFKTVNGDIGVVTGNIHSDHYVVGYIKYRRTSNSTQWCDQYYCYDRVVKHYRINEVYSGSTEYVYIPYYGSQVPVMPRSTIHEVFNPVERSLEIISKPRDELELQALNMIMDTLNGTNTLPGITGSILPGIHNVKYSDIDLVVYGLKNSVDVIEFISENKDLFKPFEGERLRNWCLNTSMNTGLEPFETCRFYRVWRRGLYNGREYSLIYNNGLHVNAYNTDLWLSVGDVELNIVFHECLDSLNYPAKGCIERSTYVRGCNPTGDIDHVLSFEALYTPLFYEGGRGFVRGLLQYNPRTGLYRVLVGVRETISYVKII